MPTTRITESSQALLREIAEKLRQSQTSILDEALHDYHRKLFFDRFNQEYTALRADPEAWAEEQAERRLWDQTSADGLDS